jgi:hypothetical protein
VRSQLPPDGGQPDARALALGAAVVTLLVHRGAWVRRHVDRIELRSPTEARRRVTLEFELPAGAEPVVPVGLLPKSFDGSAEVTGAELLSREQSAELAAFGLLAVARMAGAEGHEIPRLAVKLASGTPAQGRAAVAELARGRSEDAQIAWAHLPFRSAARMLAEHVPLVVALPEDGGPRTLEYSYTERPAPIAGDAVAEGAYGRLAQRLAWGGLHVRLPLSPLRDAASYDVAVQSDRGVLLATEVHEEAGVLDIRVTGPEPLPVRAGPYVGIFAAVALTMAWFATPALVDDPRGPPFLLAVPALVAVWFAGRVASSLLAVLLRGVRFLLLAGAALCVVAAVTLAAGAALPVARVVVGLAAALAWFIVALLLESRRRARGEDAPHLPASPRAPPQPEREPHALNATRLALLACAVGAGLVVVALADNAARDGWAGAAAVFWAGLLTIFVPVVVHVWRGPPRSEALLAVVLLGVALYLVKVLHSPLDFTSHDEFSTLRTTLDLQRFGHAFEDNPLIDVHPFYPAIEFVSSGVAAVTGMSIFSSALVVIGVLRVALMAGLFLLFESAAGARVAALATVLYACNPNFVFFDSQWAYESFALPLAVLVVAMAARGPRLTWLSVPVLVALCMAHPLTTIALIGFLLVWAAVDVRLARSEGRPPRRELWMLALVGALCMTVWAALVARSLGGYLGPVLGEAGDSLADLLLGASGPKRVFGAAGAGDTPIVERLLAFAAVLLALAAVALGARPLWRRLTALGGALGVAALLYPFTLPLRLTEAGTEISNRASEFVFVGVAFLGALALTDRPLRRPGWVAGPDRRLATPLLAGLAAAALIGGVVIGTARYARLPGDYLVVADPRSVEPQGRRAAGWARERLGPGNRIVTDRANGLLMGSTGLQDPQVGEIGGRSVPGVITAEDADDDVRYVLDENEIDYLVVDERLATGLPEVGFYFERTEPGAFEHTRPPRLEALLKYDAVCPVGRVFDSGSLVVYDTRRIAESYECPADGATGGKRDDFGTQPPLRKRLREGGES